MMDHSFNTMQFRNDSQFLSYTIQFSRNWLYNIIVRIRRCLLWCSLSFSIFFCFRRCPYFVFIFLFVFSIFFLFFLSSFCADRCIFRTSYLFYLQHSRVLYYMNVIVIGLRITCVLLSHSIRQTGNGLKWHVCVCVRVRKTEKRILHFTKQCTV